MLAFEHAGWRLHETLVWVKDSMVLGHSDYHWRHEPLLFGYAPGEGRRGRGGEGWYGGNAETTRLRSPPPRRPRRSTRRPSRSSSWRPMVRNSCPPGGIVYEPFSGSGTTLAACEATGRVCRAIELEPKYVAVALERMSASGLQPERID